MGDGTNRALKALGFKWTTVLRICPTTKALMRGVNAHTFNMLTESEPTQDQIRKMIRERGGSVANSEVSPPEML